MLALPRDIKMRVFPLFILMWQLLFASPKCERRVIAGSGRLQFSCGEFPKVFSLKGGLYFRTATRAIALRLDPLSTFVLHGISAEDLFNQIGAYIPVEMPGRELDFVRGISDPWIRSLDRSQFSLTAAENKKNDLRCKWKNSLVAKWLAKEEYFRSILLRVEGEESAEKLYMENIVCNSALGLTRDISISFSKYFTNLINKNLGDDNKSIFVFGGSTCVLVYPMNEPNSGLNKYSGSDSDCLVPENESGDSIDTDFFEIRKRNEGSYEFLFCGEGFVYINHSGGKISESGEKSICKQLRSSQFNSKNRVPLFTLEFSEPREAAQFSLTGQSEGDTISNDMNADLHIVKGTTSFSLRSKHLHVEDGCEMRFSPSDDENLLLRWFLIQGSSDSLQVCLPDEEEKGEKSILECEGVTYYPRNHENDSSIEENPKICDSVIQLKNDFLARFSKASSEENKQLLTLLRAAVLVGGNKLRIYGIACASKKRDTGFVAEAKRKVCVAEFEWPLYKAFDSPILSSFKCPMGVVSIDLSTYPVEIPNDFAGIAFRDQESKNGIFLHEC